MKSNLKLCLLDISSVYYLYFDTPNYLLPSDTTTASTSSCSQLYTICAISPTSFAEKNIPRGRLKI